MFYDYHRMEFVNDVLPSQPRIGDIFVWHGGRLRRLLGGARVDGNDGVTISRFYEATASRRDL